MLAQACLPSGRPLHSNLRAYWGNIISSIMSMSSSGVTLHRGHKQLQL